MRIRILLLASSLWLPVWAAASDPAATVDNFHKALHDDQPQLALNLLAADVTIYEQGFHEPTRDAYKGDHLNADIAFAKATTYQVIDRRIVWLGDTAACVISRTRARGTFQGQPVDLLGTETMVLRKAGDGWLIAHVHWSAHPADQGAA